jgi:hypothetical protein
MSEQTKRKINYVNDGFVQAQENEVTVFGRTGNELDDEAKHKVPTYAKIVTNPQTSRTNYYILIYQSTPMDPQGPYGRRERALDTKLQRVSKGTFDFYVTYLKTNNSIYLTKAQRGFLND